MQRGKELKRSYNVSHIRTLVGSESLGDCSSHLIISFQSEKGDQPTVSFGFAGVHTSFDVVLEVRNYDRRSVLSPSLVKRKSRGALLRVLMMDSSVSLFKR